MKKLLALLVVGSLLALATGCPPAATEPEPSKKNNPNPPTPPPTPPGKEATKGKVTKIEGGDITVGEKKVSVTPGATITVDGKEAKDLKGVTVGPDTTATINYDKDGKVTTVAIEKGTAAPMTEPPPPTKGKVTKIEGGDITVNDKKVSVTPGATITVDGKDAKDLKGVTVGPDTTATINY
ncbi:MAG TPA: hypothetical protein VMS17_29085, partial [Gemmataceae bacterium]|nr:hypothetical protein [Gemmataceae bacterium]